MKLLPSTLLRRLLLAFWLMIFLLAAFQYIALVKLWRNAFQELDQRMYWDVATAFATELQPLLREEYDEEPVLQKLYHFTEMNPRTDVYLVDSQGEIVVSLPYLASQRGKGEGTGRVVRISIPPIKEFLTVRESRALPLLGTDPSNANGFSPFSAASIRIGERLGYVYVVLQGRRFHYLSEGVANYYIVVWGVIAIVLMMLLTALLGSTVFFLITRRFRGLTSKVTAIAAGDLDARVEVGGDDEIGRLAADVNFMADSIISNMRRAEHTDEMRRQLVANISHDLGAPLSSAEGYLNTFLAERSNLSEEQQVERVQVAQRNVQRISRMVRELFELSKLEAREVEPEIELFSLVDMIEEEVVPKLKLIAEQNGIQLRAEAPDSTPHVMGDVAMIERVISNLVENAIRYHDKVDGVVTIELNTLETSVEVTVTDNGPGIPDQELSTIFTRFYRGNKARMSDVDGTGLGLAIVKEMLEAQDSEIKLSSNPGEGSTFSFRLPRS